jgi:CheY-like chemotaxis protein
MIVDDNLDAADAMKMLLEIYGHQITLAKDADEALLAARSAMPDVFLIDIGLPGMDGNALASELRVLPSGKRPRMIAVTGFGQQEDRQRSLAAGFDDHLIKPVCLTPLLKSLVPSTGPNASG